ncbi:uncharacterized protein TNCV_2809841 [Trichonephila clavipes]|nr:uncharacterized protein TNCV_2809841 [Trichonephila clavipes]
MSWLLYQLVYNPACLVVPGGAWMGSCSADPKLPSNIKAGYLNCKVRPYIPNPLRCFKCQRFGHSQTSCRGQLTCSRCASVGHVSTYCSLEPKCINCSQPHPSDSKICPKWKIEKQIQEIKTKNISYPEVRKLIVPQLSQTYAQAAKSCTLNNSSQTDENITKIKCPPLKLLAPLSSKQRQIFLLLLPHHPQPIRNSCLPFLQKHLLYRILSHQLPCLRQKGKLRNNHLHYIVPEKITKNRLNECKNYNKFKKKPAKNTSVKIVREQDSPNESTSVSKDPGDGKLLKLWMPWTQTLILLTRITSQVWHPKKMRAF